MKRFLIPLAILLTLTMAGCGEHNTDVGKWGILELPNGETVEGEIESLDRWSHGVTEVRICGVTYCVHPENFACYGEG